MYFHYVRLIFVPLYYGSQQKKPLHIILRTCDHICKNSIDFSKYLILFIKRVFMCLIIGRRHNWIYLPFFFLLWAELSNWFFFAKAKCGGTEIANAKFETFDMSSFLIYCTVVCSIMSRPYLLLMQCICLFDLNTTVLWIQGITTKPLCFTNLKPSTFTDVPCTSFIVSARTQIIFVLFFCIFCLVSSLELSHRANNKSQERKKAAKTMKEKTLFYLLLLHKKDLIYCQVVPLYSEEKILFCICTRYFIPAVQ